MGITKLLNSLKFFFKKKLYFLFRPELHIISDSHGSALKYIDFDEKFSISVNFCIVAGATASGLANPNSKTKAYPIFKNYLKRYVNKNDIVLLQLGEVDCGFAIWLKSNKNNIEPYEMMRNTVSTYINFIDNSVKNNTGKIIIASAILPTIKDDSNFGSVVNLRKEVKTSQLERTKMTLTFNRFLSEYAFNNNIMYLDLDDLLLDKTTNIIKDEFLNLDQTDHHPNPEKIAQIYIEKLRSLDFPQSTRISY